MEAKPTAPESLSSPHQNPSNSVAAAATVRAAGSESGTRAEPAPLLFERLVTEEAQELRTYAHIIEQQNRRLAELERQHGELEAKVEQKAKDVVALEQTLERREVDWQAESNALKQERDRWRDSVQSEQVKNERLLDLVYRKDKEIQRMIQRKYDTAGGQHHDHGHHPLGHKSSRHITRRPVSERAAADINSHHFTDTERRFVAQQQQIQGTGGQLETSAASQFWSPQEILATSGSVEAVRERNVTNSLLDFFGM